MAGGRWPRGARTAAAALTLAVLLAISWAAPALAYPDKPVRIVVPFGAGGAADVLARGLGQGLSTIWGQQVVIENRPGANTQIAAEHVARSAADGYTLFVSSEGTFVMNPYLYSTLSYDPEKDFAPITGLVALNQVLVVNPTLPVANVKELIAQAKTKPESLTFGTPGNGSASHLNMEMMQLMAGFKLVPVHYRGAVQAITDLIGDRIQMIFLSVGLVWEHANTGKLRVIATGGQERLKALPQIPTISESGLPGFDGSSWFGLFAPAGTPAKLIEKINADVRTVFSDAAFQKKFVEPNYLLPIVTSPESFAQAIKDGADKWGKVIRDAKLKVK